MIRIRVLPAGGAPKASAPANAPSVPAAARPARVMKLRRFMGQPAQTEFGGIVFMGFLRVFWDDRLLSDFAHFPCELYISVFEKVKAEN